MKKLMIAAVAVAFAAVAQAATYAWSTGPVIAYGDTTGENYIGGQYYLMKGDDSAANAFITAVLGAKADYATMFATLVADAENYGTYSAEEGDLSGLKQGSFSYDDYYATWSTTDTGTQSFYQVILDTANNGVYVSEIYDATVLGVGNTEVAIWNEGVETFAAGTAYQGSGWYTAETIPEPTSGLLMLLGMAGLALRRRRA